VLSTYDISPLIREISYVDNKFNVIRFMAELLKYNYLKIIKILLQE
jgi:hypothetical protein